ANICCSADMSIGEKQFTTEYTENTEKRKIQSRRCSSLSSPGPLVPKLCLGTVFAKLRFARPVSARRRETGFRGRRSQTEFGNEGTRQRTRREMRKKRGNTITDKHCTPKYKGPHGPNSVDSLVAPFRPADLAVQLHSSVASALASGGVGAGPP